MPTSAYTLDCPSFASDCANLCGTTITWEFQYWAYDQYHNPFPVYEYEVGSGVMEFECDELTEESSCVCAPTE